MNVKNVVYYAFSLIAGGSLSTHGQDLPAKKTRPVVTIFSHGIADTYKQVYWYLKSYTENNITYNNPLSLINGHYVSFNYPDATERFYRVNWTQTSFGQQNEMNKLYDVYQKTLTMHQDCDIVLFGLSRGASNVGIFAGTYPLNNVKALILESPYNSITEIIEFRIQQTKSRLLTISMGETIAELLFRKYTRHGLSPNNCASTIMHDMPILIICSKEDSIVPYQSSVNLYKKLVATGHKHAYILITNRGKHAHILDGPDGALYHATVNAFYRKYNLPHCPISADTGDLHLALCQPIL